MSQLQKYAWYNLVVIAVTLIVVGSLWPFLGSGAMGGLGCLGLIGLGVIFFRKKPGQVLVDERDNLIQKRAAIIAYSIFWVVFVLIAALLTPVYYGANGAVPVIVVQFSVFWALMLVYAVSSIAILVQYARESPNGE